MSGMCKNPFAGNHELIMIDDQFMAALEQNKITVDQAVALRVIKMSVRDYLYFGLGQNGISAEQFLEAYQYLFKVRWKNEDSWRNTYTSKRVRNRRGVLKMLEVPIHREEVRFKTFDTHFDTSGLSGIISEVVFLNKLKKKRGEILALHSVQILRFIKEHLREEWKSLPKASRKGKYAFPRNKTSLRVLLEPDSPLELAKLLLYGRAAIPTVDKEKKMETKGVKYLSLLFTDS